jgi:hypothetical protein
MAQVDDDAFAPVGWRSNVSTVQLDFFAMSR